MTGNQITAMLDNLNSQFNTSGGVLYEEDIWLDCDEIASILISTDENIYPDKNCQVYFDSNNQLLKTRYGKKENGIFVPYNSPAMITTYETVIGIILADNFYIKSPYKRGIRV